jgi:GT2 family glycosyltransferase
MSTSTAVVICAYTEERWQDIDRAIASVRRGTLMPDEIVLVIDHNPALLERARDKFAYVRVLANAHVKGLSGARNTGLHATTADVIAFLDDDAAGRGRWLEELVEPFTSSDVAVVGGYSRPVWTGRAAPKMLPPELWWVVGSSYKGLPTERGEVRNVMGCSMAFRRTALKGLGGFNTGVGRVDALPLGCEETELCIRITRSDPRWRIVLNPRSVVDHRVSPERESWRYLIRRSYAEGISKAAISRLVGRESALKTEREYTSRVLPRAVLSLIARGRLQGGAAIITAVICAGFGYVLGLTRSERIIATPTLRLCAGNGKRAA